MRQLLALAAFALGACSPGHTLRYRMTVEVDTPQGLKSGSSVWETTVHKGSGIPDYGMRMSERGSAVAVDLPTGTIYALMKRQDFVEHQNGNYLSQVFGVQFDRHGYPGFVHRMEYPDDIKQVQRLKPVFEQDPQDHPMRLRFADEKQPATVAKVDPADLAASFGPGVRLRRITIAYTTDRPDVHALDERLPWIPTTAALQISDVLPWSARPFAAFIIGSDFARDQN